MNEQNDSRKQESGACSPDCGCHAAGPAGKTRWIVGAIVLVAAGVLVARAMVKNHGASATPASAGFAALAVQEQSPAAGAAVTPSDKDTTKEIAALSELNTVATNMAGVFVFLPGKSEATAKAPMTQILGAAKKIGPQLRGKIGIFTLKAGTQDYKQVASQMTVPGVLAMVKGGGMSATTGDITETKLVQAFVAASSSGGCGGGGCGPSSGGCK